MFCHDACVQISVLKKRTVSGSTLTEPDPDDFSSAAIVDVMMSEQKPVAFEPPANSLISLISKKKKLNPHAITAVSSSIVSSDRNGNGHSIF